MRPGTEKWDKQGKGRARGPKCGTVSQFSVRRGVAGSYLKKKVTRGRSLNV